VKPENVERLLENEREWRLYLIEQLGIMRVEIKRIDREAFATKVIAGSLFALSLIWIEWAIQRH
jgi:hypothetical protein